MKFLLAFSLLLASSDAFLAPTNRATSGRQMGVKMAAENAEVAALRAAAAKAREDADRLAKVSITFIFRSGSASLHTL